LHKFAFIKFFGIKRKKKKERKKQQPGSSLGIKI